MQDCFVRYCADVKKKAFPAAAESYFKGEE
jgi:hypothetical protein